MTAPETARSRRPRGRRLAILLGPILLGLVAAGGFLAFRALSEEENIRIDAALRDKWMTTRVADQGSPVDWAVESRRRYGLRHDRAYVEEIERRGAAAPPGVIPEGLDRTLDIWLTDAEWAELSRQDRAAEANSAVIKEIMRGHRDVAAGQYRDAADFVVMLTERDEELEREILRKAPSPASVRFVDAKYSLAELNRFQRLIQQELGDRVSGAGVLIPVGRVDVLVDDDPTAARRALEGVVPSDAVILTRGRNTVDTPTATS